MRKNFLFYLMISFFFIASCAGDWASIKRGVTGAKSNDTDEFLVKKKDPLISPPDFEKLPVPKSKKNQQKKSDEIQTLLKKTDTKNSKSNEDKSTKLDEYILDQIKNN